MSWLLVFLGFTFLIVLHELGHFVAAKATGMRVERFFLFFPPKLVSIKRGETEYGIGAIPAGGFVKITGMNPDEELPPEIAARGYYHQPVWKRIVVIGAGPAVNIVLAFAILFFVFLFNGQDSAQTVGETLPDSPAANVLRAGDTILAVDGHSYSGASVDTRLKRFSSDISSHQCSGTPKPGCRAATPVRLKVKQGGEIRTIAIRPEYNASNHRTMIGVAYGTTPAHLGIGGAAGRAGSAIWLVTHRTASIFANIFDSQQRKQVSGVVGVSDVAHQAIGVGATQALLLLALVSLSLGIVNLLPILPLDGGHIFWSLVEKLRGRPVSFQVMERASVVGFVLVAMLFFIGLSNDIGRLTGEGFSVR